MTFSAFCLRFLKMTIFFHFPVVYVVTTSIIFKNMYIYIYIFIYIIYLPSKAVQWFHICVTSPPSELTIGQLLLSHFYQWSTLTVETFRKWWTTALPSMTGIYFPSFYSWKMKLFYSFLNLLILIWSQNHNCNDFNVFFTILIYNIIRLENGQWTVS